MGDNIVFLRGKEKIVFSSGHSDICPNARGCVDVAVESDGCEGTIYGIDNFDGICCGDYQNCQRNKGVRR